MSCSAELLGWPILFCFCNVVFNVTTNSRGCMGPWLKVSSNRLVKPGIEPVTPGLHGKWFIHYTTAICFCNEAACIYYELRHEISNNVVCVTSKTSNQPAHMPSLIRVFASRMNILWLLSNWLHLEFLSLKGVCTDSFESTHVKMPHCWKSHVSAHMSMTKAFFKISERGGVSRLDVKNRIELEKAYLKFQARKQLHACDVCGLGCQSKAALEIHKHKHSGLKPYRCHLCELRFSQSGSLNRHISKVHKI